MVVRRRAVHGTGVRAPPRPSASGTPPRAANCVRASGEIPPGAERRVDRRAGHGRVARGRLRLRCLHRRPPPTVPSPASRTSASCWPNKRSSSGSSPSSTRPGRSASRTNCTALPVLSATAGTRADGASSPQGGCPDAAPRAEAAAGRGGRSRSPSHPADGRGSPCARRASLAGSGSRGSPSTGRLPNGPCEAARWHAVRQPPPDDVHVTPPRARSPRPVPVPRRGGRGGCWLRRGRARRRRRPRCPR